MRTRVKICGVTCVEDAIVAVRAGADAVGIIQVPTARRCVSLGAACDIAAALPPFVTPVLVFADASVDTIRRTCDRTGIRTVQLHGHERVETALALHGTVVTKRLEVGVTLKPELEHWSLLDRSALAGLLLEGPGRGGTGTATDWYALGSVLDEFEPDTLPPISLAGGLSPENVGEIVARFRPFAVDVSSGVEAAATPGRKDAAKVAAFLEAVHGADCGEERVL